MTSQPVALVTGTSSGIGLWTAVKLAQRGVTVVATMRNPARGDQLRSAATESGVEVDIRALDVTDHDAAAECVAAVQADHGGIDILVNNAGRGSVATLEQLNTEALQEQLDVNYLGVAELTRLVLPGMRRAGSGRVVTVTSVGGVVGQPFADAYCAAKFAVEGLMQSLAPVMARFGVGISVVEPAAVASDFVANTVPKNAIPTRTILTQRYSRHTCVAPGPRSPQPSTLATPPRQWSRQPSARSRSSAGRPPIRRTRSPGCH